ncbi:MAG: hypothetical protein JXB00_07545 [Bacteroidales bacterium]|nr:hypothetical protein [Bacteroidales bacterium]
MSDYQKVLGKLKKGQTTYVLNDFRDIVVKIVPPGDKTQFFAKAKGGKPYPIESSGDLASETLLDAIEITEQQFNDF